MAYAPDINDQNAPQQVVGQQNPMNQPPTTSSGVGAGSNTSAGGSPQGSTAVPAATKAPPVQDLQAYLTANAPQAVQMGQNIAGNLNQTAGQVTGDINAAQQDVNNQVQAQVIPQNPNLVSEAAANPTAFVQDPNNVTAFQAQENANYGGPASFESTAYEPALTTEVQNAVQQAPDVTQPGGVAQLARGQETNPTTGMSNLDALLLQENPEAMAPIQAAIPQFGNLQGELTGAAGSSDQAIADAIAADQAAQAGVQNTFLTGPNAVVPTFQGNVGKELTADQAQTKAYDDALNNLISGENTLNPNYQTLKELVANNNADLTQFPNLPGNHNTMTMGDLAAVPNPVAAPTLAEAATPQDVSEQNALETLLGTGYTPSFNATGATPFKNPGAPLTLQSQYDPILQNLIPQVPTPTVPGLTKADLANAPGSFENEINTIMKYLGENAPSWT